ncbi:hypothetical protein LZ30DRAFT_683215 [Colletotrichum cereale]|nr:hypothetical protein LZ30DRAFT_683215 [Colletotrichum cereale]
MAFFSGVLVSLLGACLRPCTGLVMEVLTPTKRIKLTGRKVRAIHVKLPIDAVAFAGLDFYLSPVSHKRVFNVALEQKSREGTSSFQTQLPAGLPAQYHATSSPTSGFS